MRGHSYYYYSDVVMGASSFVDVSTLDFMMIRILFLFQVSRVDDINICERDDIEVRKLVSVKYNDRYNSCV